MTVTPKTIVLALGVSFLLLFAWTSRSSVPTLSSRTKPTTATAYETKESESGNVTITVTPRNLTSKMPPQFDVAFETHSVELDFDVSGLAVLTDESGQSFGTAAWDGSPPGGHHRKGTLTFSQSLPAIKTISLTFTNVAGIPTRTFTWEVIAK